jgi:hypothetical protein
MWQQNQAAVKRIRRFCTIQEKEFDMTTMGVLIWFVALMIGFFIGLKCGSA